MLILIEGLVLCFVLLLICVIGIANGPVNMVCVYEKDVQDRVVSLDLTTKKKIQNSFVICGITMFLPLLTYVPFCVYYINGATSFLDAFWQMTVIMWIMGVFDRLFIDWYWVTHTNAWFIPGTEDLMPYIPKKALVMKWSFTILGFPIISAIIAGIVELFF